MPIPRDERRWENSQPALAENREAERGQGRHHSGDELASYEKVGKEFARLGRRRALLSAGENAPLKRP
jgi:hypothetical protein